MAVSKKSTKAHKNTINVQPTWKSVASWAILLTTDGDSEGRKEGRKLILDMAEKLDLINKQYPKLSISRETAAKSE